MFLLSIAGGATTRENLAKDGREVFFFDERELTPAYPNAFLGSQVILAFHAGLAGVHKGFVGACLEHLRDMHFSELEPEGLRRYGAAADITHIGATLSIQAPCTVEALQRCAHNYDP